MNRLGKFSTDLKVIIRQFFELSCLSALNVPKCFAIPTALISVFSLINLYLTDRLSAAGKEINKLYPNIGQKAGLNKKA